tara:strand:+ start:152 stop:328 length:177 start_codon:yes stop_codon:yes gene_type:complete
LRLVENPFVPFVLPQLSYLPSSRSPQEAEAAEAVAEAEAEAEAVLVVVEVILHRELCT